MGDLTDHFSAEEFRCKGQGQEGHQRHPTCVSSELLDNLEAMRHLIGDQPVQIISGHRCAWYNSEVGGAASSQHILGNAADLPEGLCTVEQAAEAGFRGIGSVGPWAVHVDVRDTNARWEY